jgi:quercetin dioxygenase-like cupin family protein
MTELRGIVRTGSRTDPLRILLNAGESAGDVAIVEMDMAADGGGPPLHRHPTHGEGFYVLAGAITFQVGDEVITGGPGTWVFAPRNAPHTLANLGTEPGRILCVFAPAGFERRFERILAVDGEEVADPTPAERETVLLGPPLNVRRPDPGSGDLA